MARDGYGIKPLYWTRFVVPTDGPRSPLRPKGGRWSKPAMRSTRTDAGRIGHYLWNGFMPGPHTIWTQIEEVPRGCYAVFDEQHVAPRFERFWGIGASSRRSLHRRAGSRRLIAESVKLHLIADVPKVVFLSAA